MSNIKVIAAWLTSSPVDLNRLEVKNLCNKNNQIYLEFVSFEKKIPLPVPKKNVSRHSISFMSMLLLSEGRSGTKGNFLRLWLS
jgi:hypothetical protein